MAIHKKEWQLLTNLFATNRLPHALLFTGTITADKYNVALKFAQYILCQKPLTNNACGDCKSCRLFTAKNHPDLLLLEPDASGKQIKIDQVRALINILTKTSHQSGYKIVIINPADALNIAASNALLKTLEEPLGQTCIILCSSNENKLMETVRSRCQKIRFSAQNANNFIAQYDQIILNELLADLDSLIKEEITFVAFAKKYAKKDQIELINILQIICRDMLLLRLDPEAKKNFNHFSEEQILQLTKLANHFNPEKLIKLFDLLIENKKSQEHNINQELFLTEFGLLFSRSTEC
ncbi:MAG: DNA polymerase III subunit delta' [Gammaproteobacteria bacterium]|nr:DNA polymerase III subunit delta' [Gammaproteobacteria bacterium]